MIKLRGLVKKWFKLFDESDFENALADIGHATDREDFEWKLRKKLFRGNE